jgi:hypothetical protein
MAGNIFTVIISFLKGRLKDKNTFVFHECVLLVSLVWFVYTLPKHWDFTWWKSLLSLNILSSILITKHEDPCIIIFIMNITYTVKLYSVLQPVLYSYWRSSCSWRVRIGEYIACSHLPITLLICYPQCYWCMWLSILTVPILFPYNLYIYMFYFLVLKHLSLCKGCVAI